MIRSSVSSLVRKQNSACPLLLHPNKLARTESTVASHAMTDKSPVSDRSRVVDIPFASAKIGKFFQDGPKLGNTYLNDATLQRYLKRVLPDQVFRDITPGLERLGHRAATDLYDLAVQCERNPPFVREYDAFGHRVDELVTSDAWKKQKGVSAEEGIIATAYERKHGEWSRLHQMARVYLYNPSSGLYSCPIAMVDGAAKIAETLGKRGPLKKAFERLTSRDPKMFWTSGQWMTEKKGGSDVANGTETLAILQKDGTYKLYGYKWFSSATDSDMSITLARVVGENGDTVQGTKGLAMFYLETRDEDGRLNNMQIIKLKDKLGTRQLPTAELLLDGVVAHKISDDGRGVASIADMLKLTRIHNAVSSAAGMRRMLMLSRDFSTKRAAFGKLVKDHPLHIKTLADMEFEQDTFAPPATGDLDKGIFQVETRGATLFALELARLLGKEDCNMATQHDSDLLRLLNPVAKLYTAKLAMKTASEGLESFGGFGYLEDTDLPRLMRDAQVLPIWEGTTNILAHDVLRAIAKSKGTVLSAFHHAIMNKLSEATKNAKLEKSVGSVSHALGSIITFASQNPAKLEMAARDFAFSLARTFTGALLIEHANWSEATEQDVLTANRWCGKPLELISRKSDDGQYEASVNPEEFQLVFDGYSVDSKL